MSYGKMNGFATIIEESIITDDEGFKSVTTTTVADVRCYREGRHGSVRWANLAAFSDATDLFRIRSIPNVSVTTDHIIDYNGERFKILSVENVKSRGLYTEILAQKVVSTVG